MKSRIINVVCAADNNFSLPLAVTITSVITNLDPDRSIHLFIIDGGITRINRRRLFKSWNSKRLKIVWIKPDRSQMENLTISRHVNLTTYFRLQIPKLLPPSIQKCIYLDCDLLVMNDLSKLWDIDIEDYPLLAIQDVNAPYICAQEVIENFNKCAPYLFASTPIPDYKSLGISPQEKYFNGGVLVINLDKWRKEEIPKKIFEYLERNKGNLIFWDQDGLNAILAGKWMSLDHRWNQTAGIYNFPSWRESPFPENLFKQIIADPWIIHFSTASKPWHPNCRHPHVKLFFKYVDQTDWAGWRPNIPSIDKFFELYSKESASEIDISKANLSVIMINWNGAEFLDQAIQSVLNQSIDDFEFIVVDNCSEDGSRDIIEKYFLRYPKRVKTVYLENPNLSQAFNEGFKASGGNIISFMDSVDIWFPNKLENVKVLLSKREEIAFHQHNLFVVDEYGISWKKFIDIIGAGDFLTHSKKLKSVARFAPISGLSFNRPVLERIFPIPDQITPLIGEYLTNAAMCFGEVLATAECMGGYRQCVRNIGCENLELESNENIQEILIPALDKFYEKNNINLRYSPPRTQRLGSAISQNILHIYQTLIPLKLRIYLWEKIPLYREIANSVDTKSE